MGFLPQYYTIKNAITNTTGLGAPQAGTNIYAVTEPRIQSTDGTAVAYIFNQSASNISRLAIQSSLTVFGTKFSTTITDIDPIAVYLSEDSMENKLVIDVGVDHIVPKSSINTSKSFENGKLYTNIIYTNSGASLDIVTVRIAVRLGTASSVSTTSSSDRLFMIYSESIDPITIGTGETVQIKIEV